MQSKAKTASEYIQSLPADRAEAITKLRKQILKTLPKGFEECMSYGMIGYVVPHKLYPAGYHCTPELPLPFISIASQKNYISFYHMALYDGKLLDWFQDQWKEFSDKKLDMGKCCVRFKKPEQIPFELMGDLCTKITPSQWIEQYEKAIKNKIN
jgi:hypothetical protein